MIKKFKLMMEILVDDKQYTDKETVDASMVREAMLDEMNMDFEIHKVVEVEELD